MKTMYANIKKVLKAILANYMTAMEMYGEALNRSRGVVLAYKGSNPFMLRHKLD